MVNKESWINWLQESDPNIDWDDVNEVQRVCQEFLGRELDPRTSGDLELFEEMMDIADGMRHLHVEFTGETVGRKEDVP